MIGDTEKRRVTSGHDRLHHVVTVSVVLIVASIAGLGLVSRNATAQTIISGWTGWYGNGNNVIYMTTGITDLNNPYILPTSYKTGIQTSSQNFPNAVNLTVGRDVSTSLQDLIPHYFFDSKANVMRIYLPVAVASGTGVAKDLFGSGSFVMVFWQKVSATGFTGTGQITDANYNSGINATRGSTFNKGTISSTQLSAIYKLTWDAMGMLPGAGFVIGSYSIMQDFEALEGVDSSASLTSPFATNSAPAYETFDIAVPFVNCGTFGCAIGNQQVFAPQTLLDLTISGSQFTTSSSFVVAASNTLGYYAPSTGQINPIPSCTGCLSPQGASASVSIPAVPAVTLTGQVTAMGKTLPNAVVNIEATSGSQSGTIFRVNTDAGGNYRFFAQVGTTYAVWATYLTAGGTATSSTYGVSADPSPTAESQNIVIAAISQIYGTVTSGGVALPGASVSATLPAVPGDGCAVCATTDANGNYYFFVATTGTYTVQASKSGYNVATAYPTVSAMGISVYQAFSLTKSSGGGGGCVLTGTLIATPSGDKRVDRLAAGDAILGYNVTAGSWASETVTSNTHTDASQILSINNGLLEVTLTEQPLYVRNGTWAGWVHDPQNLTVGEQVFSPRTGQWISIVSLQTLQGSFRVYDLRVTSPNDFVANGVLTLDKIG